MRKIGLFFVVLGLVPVTAQAQNTAPGMFGVREVVVEYARFDDSKAADTCGLSRDMVGSALAKALAETMVPAIAVSDVRPPTQGVARIQLIPEISTRTDESLNCVSRISLAAESHANIVIPPITIPRSVTVVYWRQQRQATSGQSSHAQIIVDILHKMAEQFAQQYKLDQPPELPK